MREDIRISEDRIIQIGRLTPRRGERVLDARGLAVAPGFIDAHSHADSNVDTYPLLESQIRQGITTAIVGQDGGGETPIASLFEKLQKAKPAINFAAFAGHGVLREKVMGIDFKRTAAREEIEKMKNLLEADMKAGALGLSSGLEYDPGSYSTTSELIDLASVAAKYGGIYISHMRDEGNDALKSFGELIEIAEKASLPAQVSHIKLGTAKVWGKGPEVVRMIDSARKRGLSITADVYPYVYWQSTITVLTLEKDYDDRKVWERALADVGGPQNVLLSEYSPNRNWAGKNLAQIAEETGKDAIAIIQEIIRKTHGPEGSGTESIVCTAMRESDLIAFLKAPWTMICSDGRHLGTHPRGAGSFPRVLRIYVREKKVLSLSEAIRKMTSLPAWRFGLRDRGKIAKGMIADVVVFNPKTIADRATPQRPTELSVGMVHVIVNGLPVLANGKLTGRRPGSVLRKMEAPLPVGEGSGGGVSEIKLLPLPPFPRQVGGTVPPQRGGIRCDDSTLELPAIALRQSSLHRK